MPDDAAWVWRTIAAAIRPEPALLVSEWADKHRVLPPTSAEPGRWRTSRVPYMRGVMDALSTGSPFERVVMMKGAQVAATECGNNWLGYIIQHAPGTTLCVLPSLDDVRKNVVTRIEPLIASSPALAALVAKPVGRRAANSMMRKEFPGGFLVFTGATSPKGLRSTPARYLFLDEVDGFPGDAGNEGDPVALAEQRTVTFRGRRKIFLCSTPTIKGLSRIERAYLESDQRVFEVPCQQCATFNRILWADIRWPEGERRKACWVCPDCGFPHEEHAKPALLAAGRWRATAPGDGRTAGFHLSALYSPFEPWGDIAVQHGQAKGDPSAMQAWTNLKLGDPFEDMAGEEITADAVASRAETIGDVLPPGAVLLTAGVDTQDDRLEVEVVAWGAGEESWSILHHVIPGDPADRAVWLQLDELLSRTWPHARAVPDMPISAVCVDTGGHHTQAAYNFVRDKQARRVWAIKGHNVPGKQIWPRKPSHKNKGRVPLYLIGVHAAKEVIFARLKIKEAGPGFMHFPMDRSTQYFQQLTAEKMVTKWERGRPRRIFVNPTKARNEALDLRVYAFAALHGVVAAGFDLDRAVAALAPMPPRTPDRPVMAPPPPVRRATRSSWLSS